VDTFTRGRSTAEASTSRASPTTRAEAADPTDRGPCFRPSIGPARLRPD
jgi:hypothetical protein